MSMLTGTTQPTADPGTRVVAKPADESRLPGPLLFVSASPVSTPRVKGAFG